MEQQASNGGLQYVPQIAVQYIYLDFDGELTSYNGEILNIDNVEVQNSRLTAERISSIVAELNTRYAAQNVIFVTSRPESIEYSTIYIGKTEAFSPYGSFAGLAETIDKNNQNKSDNAFIMLDASSSDEAIIFTISHETDHLLGTFDHGGEGLQAYAVNYDIANGMNVNNVSLQENDSMCLYSGGIANGTTVGFSGYLDVASGGIANNTVVEHLGSMHISTGGVANKIITDTGGNVVIFCSGSADDVTVNHGGYLYVSSGGSAQNIKETGGYVGIEEGAAVSFVSNTISGCFSGGSVSIHSQTSAVDVSLSATAKMTVFAGGVASNTYLRGYSYYQPFLNISSGGYAKETTVSNDAWLYVSHGGFVESTLVESGNMSVLSGGTASKITISGSPQSNGMLYVYGTAGEVYADSDASVQVQALGSASGVTICQSASLSICGKVSDANIQGYAVVSDLGVLDDSDISGHLRISAGGIAENTENHGAIYIHSGGIAQNIRNHGVMHISSLDFYSIEEGGIAQNTVNYHEMHISGGGIATDTVLDANGINIGKVYISSGGRAQNVFFKYGEVYVYAAGLADNVTLNPLCGSLTVFSGGTANIAYSPWTYGDIESRWGAVVNYLERDYSVYYGNNSSGVISKSSALNDLTVLSGNQLLIYSAGSVKNTNILTGGDMRIFGGGTANNTTVNSGGLMYVESGGTANSTTINAYGKMSICSGGIANDTVVSGYDAVMYISSGGVASNTVLSGVRGSMYISSGGSANSITIRNSGTNGRINASSGGIVSNIFVESNSVLVLLGSAHNVLVHGVANCETACNVIVESGGTVSGNIFSSIVKSGAFSYISGANETQLYGEMIVASNGSADNTVIERSGIMYIHSSGTAAQTTVLSGGTMHVSGTANETTVSSGGYIFFSGNSAASHQDLTLLKGGIIGGCFTYTEDKHWDSFSTTSYGKGIAEDNVFVASGHITVSSGGIAHNMVIHSGGVMWVNNGCVADNTIIENGSIIVAAEGTACNTIVNGSGNLNIYEKGTVSGTIINSGGKLNLLSSGSAVDTVICSGGTVTFSSGGILSNTVIESGGAIVLSNGGGASQTTISSGGALTLTRHGTVSGLTVHSGASVNVIDNGWIHIGGSDTLGYASFSDWGVCDVRSGGFVHDITIGSNGYLTVHNGSASAVVLNGGIADVYNDGVAKSTSIHSNGSMHISCGGSADNTSIISGGKLFVLDGGVINNTVISRYGTLLVSSGGAANSLTVNSGGSATLYTGAVLQGKSTLGGKIVMSGTATATGANLDFAVNQRKTTDGYLINNLSLISGAPTYTITVSANQASGTYKLAQGAENFTGSISVGDGSVNYGRVTVNGEDLIHGSQSYSLDSVDGNLSLSISEADITPPELTITSDPAGWTNKSVTLTVSANEDCSIQYQVNNGSWIGYSAGGIAINSNCEINFKATDLQGNISEKSFSVGNIDNQAPVVSKTTLTGVIDGNSVTYDWTDIFSDDLSGIQKYVVQWISGKDLSLIREFSTTSSVYSTGAIEDGKYYLKVKAIDNAGNESTVKNADAVTVDTAPPTVPQNVVVTNSKNSVTVTWSPSTDAGIGLQKYVLQISSDVSFSNIVQTQEISYKTSYALTLDDGKYYFRVKAVDYQGKASNWSQSATVIIDSAAPDAPVAQADITTVTNQKVTVTATFSTNSIIKEFSLNNKDWNIYTTGIVFEENGTVYFRGKDEAGNYSPVTSYEVYNIDKVAPNKPTANADIISVTNQNVTVTATFSSDSTVKEFSLNNKDWQTYTAGVVMSDNRTVYFRGKDEAGNYSPVTSYSVNNIDKAAPDMPVAQADITTVTNQNVTVTATFSSDSMVKEFSLNNKDWNIYTAGIVFEENGTVYFRGKDEAGNVSAVTSYEVYNIDKVAPEVPASFTGSVSNYSAKLDWSDAVDGGTSGLKGYYFRYGTSKTLNGNSSFVSESGKTLSNLAVGTWYYQVKAVDNAGNTSVWSAIQTFSVAPGKVQNLQGSSNGLSWTPVAGVNGYTVEFSKDNFKQSVTLKTTTAAVDLLALSPGSYQIRVKADNGSYSDSRNISVNASAQAQVFSSDSDGNTDVFFASGNTVWENGYAASHQGVLNGWSGTEKQVQLTGKNRLDDVFCGSNDANVLIMTDDANGDALFLDDIYTSLGNQARLSLIDEIRAGIGDDIVDLTSQRYACSGNGLTIYGGSGNDTIWANCGSNTLFGDSGCDNLIGGSDNDVLIGGSGNDSMHGGGGDDIFCFGGNWGTDTIEQLADGKVTLWFENGSASKWNASTLTYTDGVNSVSVSGTTQISLKFGNNSALPAGAFADAASEKIFEDKNKGMLA